MTVSKEEAMQMFDRDLEILMDDLRGMQAHYQIAEWEAFVFLRKPDCPESYVMKYAAAVDEFAKRIVQLHATPATPSNAAMRAAEEIGRSVAVYAFKSLSAHLANWTHGYNKDAALRARSTIAAIITRHLAATSVRQENAVEWLGYAKSELECHAEWWRQMYQPHFHARARQALAMVEDIEKVIAAAATTSPEIPEFPKCVKCGHDNVNSNNGMCIEFVVPRNSNSGHRCGCKCEFTAPVATGDDEGEK